MLEILGIALLCSVNAKNAAKRGRKPGMFVLITLALWIGLEIVGALIGNAANLELGAYGLALLFALAGGGASFFIAKNCKPGPYTDLAQSAGGAAAGNLAGQAPQASQASQVPQASQASQAPQAPATRLARFCTRCGAPLSDASAFCEQCGAPRTAMAQTAAPAAIATAPAAQAQAAPEEAVPENPRHAIVAGIVLAASWVVIFLIQGIFRVSLSYNTSIAYFVATALLGVGVYLFTRQDRQSLIAGGIFGAAFALAFACSSFALHVDNGRESAVDRRDHRVPRRGGRRVRHHRGMAGNGKWIRSRSSSQTTTPS